MAEEKERDAEEVKNCALALYESEHYAFLCDLHFKLGMDDERALLAKPDFDEDGYRGFHSRHAGRARLLSEIRGLAEALKREIKELENEAKEKLKREEDEKYAGG